MTIPTDELARGCSAHLSQSTNQENAEIEAANLVQAVLHYNGDNVMFRSGYDERDILRHVFRWTTLEPETVFPNGFRAPARGNTPETTYWNIDHYVHHGGAPLETHQNNYGFISTTMNSAWVPQTPSMQGRIVYRYEIYAPGGIWVAQTLANYQFPSQEEIIFVNGINRQYIRSAQRFRLIQGDRGRLRRERVDHDLIINPFFDPASHPTRRLLSIECPIDYYMENNRRVPLRIRYTDPTGHVVKRSIVDESDQNRARIPSGTSIWYGEEVSNTDTFINAGFRSYYTNEVYLFMRQSYVLLDYAPGSTNDKVLNGPLLIKDGFPSLANTAFALNGIDCAFGSHDHKEAYIFTGNLCARINYAPRTTDDFIIDVPKTIGSMFPFFIGTGFEKGVDAAFESSVTYEAYIFKGDRYALINYKEPKLIGGPRKIVDGFYCLKNTIFASGIDAAFASHQKTFWGNKKEAYLFKGDQYILINFAPGGTEDYIINGPKRITPSWPSLAEYLPLKNHGLDS